ncbi:class II aldolase/adducin family protein [Pectinatus frisingensis]|uniref:class II aldolase/adducin family protein n=1 Tax=Pectinatus frisingensis TaxID=865 RepID=UPI0018C56A53|nr:class II aldolase/adducin family protein [Pectinatus frisingensis]
MLEELKKQVVKYALQADRSGLCKHRSGNFSIRDTKTNYVCITPTGMDRKEMTYHDIIVLDLNAVVIESETSQRRPTSESLMHLEIYKHYANINAIAHTHSRYATAFSVLKKPIPAIVYEILGLGCKEGFVPIADYGRPGTLSLAKNTAKALKKSDVALMQAHGVIAVDTVLKEALLKASYVEELAEIYYHTLVINNGKEPPYVPDTELQKWEYPAEITLLGKNIQTSI